MCKLITDTPIVLDTWKKLLPFRNVSTLNQANIVELGFSGLFFNRTNFSGILNANPIGGINQNSKYTIDCRFNKPKVIEIIRNLSSYKEKVEVHFNDALIFMNTQKKNFLKKDSFAYLDPPYYNKGPKIYRHFYRTQDHINLAKYVKSVKHLDWIVSYDDAQFICGLYAESSIRCRPLFLDYTCASKIRTHGRELLISNLPLPPFVMASAQDI